MRIKFVKNKKGYCPFCGCKLDKKRKICSRCGYGIKVNSLNEESR